MKETVGRAAGIPGTLMSEVWIREFLLFGGAVAGAVWGYLFGRFVGQRRLAGEMRGELEALERSSIKVCQTLEGLERALASPATFVGAKSP
jgi:membrane protein YqaA with SNARE-associated domain